MNSINRPTRITTILKTIGAGDDAEISAELEIYITDLEAKQPDRPARIAAILTTLGSKYPADMGISLEAYVSDLETTQQAVLPNSRIPSWDPKSPPKWSHQRQVERDQHRRQRAISKQNNFR